MNITTKSNVYLLALAQACMLATTMTIVTYAGLAGKMMAPTPALATLPISLAIIVTALTTGLMSGYMGRHSRKAGFYVGIAFGVSGALIAMAAIWFSIFWMLCFGIGIIGVFMASGQYFRFSAMESVPSSEGATAISTVLIGGLLAAILAPPMVDVFMDMLQPNIYVGSLLFVAFAVSLTVIPISFLKPVAFTEHHESDGEGIARPLMEVARQRVFIVAVLNSAAGFAIMSFVMTASPLAMEICGIGPDVSIRVIQGHVIAMFLPSLISGHLIERFGIVKILLSGHLLFIASFVSALTGIEIANFSLSLIFLGIGWNFCFVGGTALLVKSYKTSETSKVQGLNETLVYICQGTASLGAGAVLYYLGWFSLVQIAAIILAITMVFTLWYAMSSPRTA